MSNKFRDIDIKNSTCYFFNNIIDIKNFDPNNINIQEKSYKDITTLDMWLSKIRNT